MGLAAAKSKRKLAKDPNNTKWSRNTDSFGHRMLRSHGWAPGQYLGPEDASHAEFHTAASASHIRVSLRADNLGLGAKKNQGDECTGLDVFKDLLGRLNGKDETVIEEQRKAREVFKMSHYIERKFGAVRFVSGGLLVGDQVQKLVEEAEEAKAREPSVKAESPDTADESLKTAPVKKESKSKKRKATDSSGDTDREERKAEKRRRKEEKRKEKSKKKKDRSARSGSPSPEDVETSKTKSSTKKSKTKRKAEKSKSRDESSASEKSESDSDDTGGQAQSDAAAAVIAGRHLARKRFIAQKRRAIMDPAALNQIFMIKT